MSDSLASRIQHPGLARKVQPPDEAVRGVRSGAVVAVSGFTKAGEPKVVLPALARHLERLGPDARITLYSGASLSDEAESPLAAHLARRAPYMSCEATRRLVHAGAIEYADVHLSQFARSLAQGLYGPIDLAIVEVSRIRADGGVVLTSSVGVSAEALAGARGVILEVNTAEPDYTGFHDIVPAPAPPALAQPVPIVGVLDRVGTPFVRLDPGKVVAVVESRARSAGVLFKPAEDVHRRIADHVVEFLLECRERLGWGDWTPPLQSGVGNVANAVIAALYDSPFRRLRFWTEVFQDGMLRFVEDRDKFAGASATGLSLSREGAAAFERQFDRCRDTVVLRPMWVSNSAEVIARLFVVAMNTPLEVDLYGHANSTHLRGSRVVNGLGGSGDFFRNGYLSIAHTPSHRRLGDGRVVSCVMPYLDHVDHTEHDLRCVVTEQGFADLSTICDPRHRAARIIDRCAHPHFRPVLRDYLAMAECGDEPRITRLDRLQDWWRAYEQACASFPD